jgi:replication-associated recombination protein RarA
MIEGMKRTATGLLPNEIQNFDDLVLIERIKRDLYFFYEAPEHSPQVMLFYGKPGIGKTSFATLFGRTKCCDFEYFAMNECVRKHVDLQDLQLNTRRLSSYFGDDLADRPIKYLTILDEFHNLSERQQDIFKVKLETLGEEQRVIICLNTSSELPLSKACASAIRSRCHLVNFDPKPNELTEHKKLVQSKFPTLSLRDVEVLLPDMRAIAREHKLRVARNGFYESRKAS